MQNGTIYEFSEFRLIPCEELLLRNGEPIPLSPKVYATLAMLIERHGHLVKKDELINRVWPDTFVEEAAVSKCMWALRHALGEDSKRPRFIQTFPKRGYKFVAEVSEINEHVRIHAPSESNGSATAALYPSDTVAEKLNGFDVPQARSTSQKTLQPAYRRSFLRHRHVFTVAAVLLLFIGVFAAYFYNPWVKTSSDLGRVTLAVLPFQPISGPNRDELYGIGIADALINRLSTLENFQVRPLTSVRRYAEIETNNIDAGREQKVDYVLASRYQLVEGKIRVTAQLVNVAAGKTVEAYEFQKAATDIFTAQDAIALELKHRLTSKFGDREFGTYSERGTNNQEAYRYYLLAQNFNELRGQENGRKALEQIDRALELDPHFARAWATKAYIHRYMGYGPVAIEHSLRSIDAVERALALDPNLSEAHSALCFNKFRFEYDFDAAERACMRAIELDPNSPLAYKLYSNFLYTRGRFEEAISVIEKAVTLQPVSYDNQQTYGLALYFSRRYADAEAQWKQLIPLNPDHKLIYGQLVKSLIPQGKDDEALEHLIKFLVLEKADDVTIKRFRAAFAESGWRGVTLERIRLGKSQPNHPTFELARFYATIDDKDNAFKYLELAYEQRSNMIAVLEVDPELDRLRDDPRYADLLRIVRSRNRS